jgi:hypothetical protein
MLLKTPPPSKSLCLNLLGSLCALLCGLQVSRCLKRKKIRRTLAGRSSDRMLGRTPPCEMTTEPRSLLSSSSFRTASCKCRGTIRDFLLSRAALPASSRISAARSDYQLEFKSCKKERTYTRERQRGRRGNRNRFAGRSFPSSTIGGYVRRGLIVSVRSRVREEKEDVH